MHPPTVRMNMDSHRKNHSGRWTWETLLTGAWRSFSYSSVWLTRWLAMLQRPCEKFPDPFLLFFSHRAAMPVCCSHRGRQHGKGHTTGWLSPQQTVNLFLSLGVKRSCCSPLFSNTVPFPPTIAHVSRVLPLSLSEELWICKLAGLQIQG